MLQVDDGYRARVSSVYMLGIIVGPPIATFAFGRVSEFVGLRGMALVMAAVLGAQVLYVFVAHGGYRRLDRDEQLPVPEGLRFFASDRP